ncbi:MAG: helix-hairpin-helix domain-containing protein [Fuerstiella sp.]
MRNDDDSTSRWGLGSSGGPVDPEDSGLPWGFIMAGAVVLAIFVVSGRFERSNEINRIDPMLQQLQEKLKASADRRHKLQQLEHDERGQSQHDQLMQIVPIDVNSASYKQLRLLPRIRHEIAEGIISGRPFQSIEELDDVYGIGPKTIDLIRPHIVVHSMSSSEKTNGNEEAK